MIAANPYTQYRKVQVETADQRRVIIMLYDGALRFLGGGMSALRRGDLEAAHKNLLRAQDIVCELMASLDLEAGEVAGALYRLYEYSYHLLLQANMKKEIEPLYQVEKMLLELREAWQHSQL